MLFNMKNDTSFKADSTPLKYFNKLFKYFAISCLLNNYKFESLQNMTFFLIDLNTFVILLYHYLEICHQINLLNI